MRLANKRGILLLSDLTWFLIFVICATLIFFFFYHPMNLKATARASTSFEGTSLEADAQYVANVLPQLPAHLSANIDPSFAQVTSNPNPKIADLISEIANEHSAGRDINKQSSYLLYKDDLKKILNGKILFEATNNKFGKSMQKYTLTRISVLLRINGKTIDVTNCDKTIFNDKSLCDAVIPDRDDYTTIQEFKEKKLRCSAQLLACDNPNAYYDIGWTYIPSESGVVTMEVITTYEKGDGW